MERLPFKSSRHREPKAGPGLLDTPGQTSDRWSLRDSSSAWARSQSIDSRALTSMPWLCREGCPVMRPLRWSPKEGIKNRRAVGPMFLEGGIISEWGKPRVVGVELHQVSKLVTKGCRKKGGRVQRVSCLLTGQLAWCWHVGRQCRLSIGA